MFWFRFHFIFETFFRKEWRGGSERDPNRITTKQLILVGKRELVLSDFCRRPCKLGLNSAAKWKDA